MVTVSLPWSRLDKDLNVQTNRIGPAGPARCGSGWPDPGQSVRPSSPYLWTKDAAPVRAENADRAGPSGPVRFWLPAGHGSVRARPPTRGSGRSVQSSGRLSRLSVTQPDQRLGELAGPASASDLHIAVSIKPF